MADTNTIQGLHQRAEEIRYAHLSQDPDGSNSDERVGSLLVDIVDLLGSGSGDLGTFLSTLNSSSALNNATPGSGQTIVYNGTWGFGDAGGGGGSFPAGSVLASLLANGNNPGTPSPTNCVIKWTNAGWVFAEESGTGGDISSCLTKTAYAASKFWGRSPVLTSGASPHYEVTGPLAGGIDYIEFSNGVRIGINSSSDDSTIKVYRENTIDPTTQESVTHVGHIYATGGVSALGNSSGGGGGGGGGLTANSWAEFFDNISHQEVTDTDGYLRLAVGGTSENPTYTLDWATPTGTLPSMTGHEGHYLKVINNGGTLEAAWATAPSGTGGVSSVALWNSITSQYEPFVTNGETLNLFAGSNIGLTLGTNNELIIAYTGGSTPGGSGTVTSISAGTGLTTGTNNPPITTSGTISLATIPDLTTGTYTKVTIDSYGRVTSGANPTTLSDYGIIDAVPNSTTWWGCGISGGKVLGTIDAGSGVNDPTSVVKGFIGLELNTYGKLNNLGGYIDFKQPGASSNYTTRLKETSAGELTIEGSGLIIGSTANDYIQIGAVKIICEANNTLKIIGADGYAGHLYATGGISALGLSSGSSPSIGNLTVTDTLSFTNGFTEKDDADDNRRNLKFTTTGDNVISFGNNAGRATFNSSGQLWMLGTNCDIYLQGNKLHLNSADIEHGVPDVYLYWDGNALKLMVGTTPYIIAPTT